MFLEASDSLSRAELRSAQERARHQARVSRRLRHLLITAVVLLLAATGAGLYAAEQTRTARNARTTAERAAIDADARRVGARALLSDEISLSLLLVVAGVRLADSPESGVNLLAAVGQHPHLVRSAPAGGGYVDFMDVSRDGRWLAAADDHNRMHLYDRRTQRVLRSYDFGSATADAQAFVVPAFAPDNRTLAAVTMNPSRRPVRLLDPRTMTEKSPRLIWPEQRPARGVDLQFSADGRYLAVSFRGPGVNPDVAAFDDPAFLLVWDLHDPGGAPRRISLGNAANGLALSPDGGYPRRMDAFARFAQPWIDRAARIGADPRDDDELRLRKALLVLVCVLILPISLAWGAIYLALGAHGGPHRLAVPGHLGRRRSRSSRGPATPSGSCGSSCSTSCSPRRSRWRSSAASSASGAVGLWGILAPLGALVFNGARSGVRWFVAFLAVFLVSGIVGELAGSGLDLPGLVRAAR